MAYPHYLIEVPMDASTVSTGAPTTAVAGFVIPYHKAITLNVTFVAVTNIGLGVWQPMCVPHKIHRIGVRTLANLADPQDLLFWKRLEGGATTWGSTAAGQPTGIFFRMMLPTNTATGKICYKNVTGNYIVYPGEALTLGVSTAIDTTARISLLVSPVFEQPANVTSMVQTTAP